jgi:hypothetical protein
VRIDHRLLSQVPKLCGLIGSVRSIESEQKSLRLRHAHRTLLALLTPPVNCAVGRAATHVAALTLPGPPALKPPGLPGGG